jgi:hypothetical protein
MYQKYGPPEVGCALQISAMERPTSIVMQATTTQPHTITAGPPVVCGKPVHKVLSPWEKRKTHETKEEEGGQSRDNGDDAAGRSLNG